MSLSADGLTEVARRARWQARVMARQRMARVEQWEARMTALALRIALPELRGARLAGPLALWLVPAAQWRARAAVLLALEWRRRRSGRRDRLRCNHVRRSQLGCRRELYGHVRERRFLR
jgi:hypothetical protein